MPRRHPAAVLTVLVAAGLVATCGDGSDDGAPATTSAPVAVAMGAPDKDPLVVGAVLDLEGPDAAVEGLAAAAVEAAVEQLDGAGGVAGRPVVADVRDGRGDLAATVDAVIAVLDGGADLVVLGCRADLAAAAAAVADDRSVPSVSACAPTADVGTAVGPTSFSLGVPADVEGRALARVALRDGALSAVVVTEVALPGSIERCDAFRVGFADDEHQVLATVELAAAGLAAADAAAAAVTTAPDVVVSCASGPATQAVRAALAGAGWSGVLLAGSAADTLVAGGTALGDGAVGGAADRVAVSVLSLVPGSDRPGTDAAGRRREVLTDAAGTALPGTALAAAAAVELWAAAVEAAGSTDPATVAVALADGAPDTVLGPVRFDATQRLRRPVNLHLVVLGAEGTRTEDAP